MEVFETFGLEWHLVVAQIINFIVIFLILRKYMYKPLLQMIKKRQDLAAEAVEKSQESDVALEKAEKQEKEILKKAQTTASQIVTDAKEQAAQIVKDAEDVARKQTEKMLSDAKIQIEQETTKAQAQLNKYVATLSVDLLKKSLGNVFSEKEQTEIMQKAVKEIQKEAN